MKTCWQLEIESTTQIDIIRRLILLAYRRHIETDPQGFSTLRQPAKRRCDWR